MNNNKEILIERERCKKIINRKFKELKGYREKRIKREHRKLVYAFERLKEDILFLIDNPNYVRIKDREIKEDG